LPALTEDGGRVNRVGFTRLARQGSLLKFGFFTEFTQESLDFDTDETLMDHLSTELMNGAVQLTEAVLQRDLLAACGVILYAGSATSQATVTGEGATPSVVSYKNIMRLDQILTNNRTPKQTTVITGSRMIDTATIPAARVMFVGIDLVPLLKGMTDLFGNKAFVSVQHYADAGTILNGEIGSIDNFRIIQVPEMLHYAGAGAAVGTNPGYQSTSC
jgi:N4-gp56 family major capsid protein